MSERSVRSRVTKTLKPLHGFAVENPCLPGTPDVNCSLCWIELKWLEDWPKRAASKVRIPHYTSQQRLFATKRDRAGERCFLLLQVESTQEWLLLDGVIAAQHLNNTSREELTSVALAHWAGREMEKNLIECLRNNT